MRAFRSLVAGALVLSLMAAPSVSAAPASTTLSDVVVGFTFVVGYASLNAPDQALRLRPGDTVEWTNLDPVAHSITFEAMPTVLYLKRPGDKASMTFTQAGYYVYTCVEHPQAPGMTGLVFVADDTR
ncbi:MAG TPA: plastocyanin/azurin family copper-binding protein [Acidimicrobiia bacterium]|nr:plastocyanin/azurin family copper-binding protein [Acidimicrobiia bacterium]